MGRNKGDKDLKPRATTPASTAQRQNAWAKQLESRQVVTEGTKVGQVKKKITDGYKKLNVIKQNVDCSTCEIVNACKYKEIVKAGELDKCPLYPIYRNAVVDVTQNPLMYLSKVAARLEVAIKKQSILDAEQGKPLSRDMLSATKVALEAVKISQNANKGRRQRVVGKQDEIVIDAEAFNT